MLCLSFELESSSAQVMGSTGSDLKMGIQPVLDKVCGGNVIETNGNENGIMECTALVVSLDVLMLMATWR